MTAVVTVSAIVSLVPVTTTGTLTGYATLPEACTLASGQISCEATAIPSTSAATRTQTAILTSTSTTTASSNTVKPSTASPSPSSSAEAPTATPTAVKGPTYGSNQVWIALGVALGFLVLLALGWLVLARRRKLFPFKQRKRLSEGDGVAMAEVAKPNGEKAGRAIRSMAQVSPSRPMSKAPSIRPPSSRYSQEIDSEKPFQGQCDNWPDVASSISRRTPTIARDYISAGRNAIPRPFDSLPVRPYSPNGHGPVFHSTSPWLPSPQPAALQDDRSNISPSELPETSLRKQERSVACPTPVRNWFGGRGNGSSWSLQRQMGSQTSQASLVRPPSARSDVARSQYDRVTGFEYLLQTGREHGVKQDR